MQLSRDPFGRPGGVKTNPGFLSPDVSEPAGPVDPDVSVLSVQSPEGRPIALLANYALHYVGGMPPLSADYFGQFAVRIEQLLGAAGVDPPFVGIMSNGTSGDVKNVKFGAPAPPRVPPMAKRNQGRRQQRHLRCPRPTSKGAVRAGLSRRRQRGQGGTRRP